jgi:hypothetical protein
MKFFLFFILCLTANLAIAGKINIRDCVVLSSDDMICDGTKLSNGSCLEGVYISIRK